jgi:colanic acid/amylovoran biosynthesis glycosyltransferase
MENLVLKDFPTPEELNLLYITGTYPLLTTTFIDREIKMLRLWGAKITVVSIRRPTDNLSKEQRVLQKGVLYLLPVSWISFIFAHLRFSLLQPMVYFRTLLYLLKRLHPNFKSRLLTFFHFNEGVYAAYLLRKGQWDQIHAHFVDRAATVALVVGRFLHVPYSLTAHASDIYVDTLLLREKLAEAKIVVTCVDLNRTYLSQISSHQFDHKLKCIYHGLDIGIYNPTPRSLSGKPVMISVGQLKERKGFSFLLRACRILFDQGYEFECRIIGEGPIRELLEAQIRAFSLQKIVKLTGALPHQEVIEEYQCSHIFVLPAVLAADGDRDGVPNVILEAMAMELPVVSTHHSGIPEVVEEGRNGLLVPPGDEHALAGALDLLLRDPGLRLRLGSEGRRMVVEKFDLECNTRLFYEHVFSRTSSS